MISRYIGLYRYWSSVIFDTWIYREILLIRLEQQPHYKNLWNKEPAKCTYHVKFDSHNPSCEEVDVFVDRQKLIKTIEETNMLFTRNADNCCLDQPISWKVDDYHHYIPINIRLSVIPTCKVMWILCSIIVASLNPSAKYIVLQY